MAHAVICIIDITKYILFVKLVFCGMKNQQNGDFMKPELNFRFDGDICWITGVDMLNLRYAEYVDKIKAIETM